MSIDIYNLAKEAAYRAIDGLQDKDKAMYFGELEQPAIYSIAGLAEDILLTYEQEYEGRRPIASLFDEIAFNQVL